MWMDILLTEISDMGKREGYKVVPVLRYLEQCPFGVITLNRERKTVPHLIQDIIKYA